MATGNDKRQIPLAIIGMACRVPGADDLDAFWQMLVAGRSATGDLAADRLDRDLYYDARQGTRGKSYTARGAVCSPEQPAGGDGLSPALARSADSTHRALARVAAAAFRHAGLDPLNLAERNTGVYVGHTIGSDQAADAAFVPTAADLVDCLDRSDALAELAPEERAALCREVVEQCGPKGPTGSKGSAAAQSHRVAGIVSQAFGLSGPFMAVNAACASSLEALLLAARALESGQIGMALVGGASVCSRDWLVLFSQARSLTATESRPFDHRADGLVVAEASVAVVVKTLERALADGDPIQAVIRGIGASTDGRGRSLWAPRSEGQVAAIRRAYCGGVDPSGVQYIEAHATATKLGDATEIASLTEVFGGAAQPGKKIPVASVKANIGHTLEAAGLIGLVKAVQCMQHGLIPKAIHVEKLNPKIDWAGAPVYVPLENTPWPAPADGAPRRAAVSAFGIGGLNVHVVLDSFAAGPAIPAAARRGAPQRPDEPLALADCRVAVIGLGCVFPGRHNIEQFSSALGSPAARAPASGGPAGSGSSAPGLRVADFQYDWRPHRIAPREVELADPLQFMVLDAADQAFRDAGYDTRPLDREMTGVIVGSQFAGDFDYRLKLTLRLPQTLRAMADRLSARGLSAERTAEIVRAVDDAWHQRWPVLEDNSGSYSASSLAVRIAKTWNLMGGASAVDSGTTSGMSALGAAMNLLAAGDCNLMLCVAAQRDINPVSQAVPGRAGLLSGEGAGVLLLKRLADAERDGDRIHAVLGGVGVSVAADTSGRALAEICQRAASQAQLDPAELALLVCDTCGLANLDERLIRAVVESQAAGSRERPLALRSVVGEIGHTGGASGMASLLAAIVCLEKGVVPAAQAQSPPAVALRHKSVVAVSGPAAVLAHLTTGHPASAAVLSHGQGLACCAIVEQSPASAVRSSSVETPAIISNAVPTKVVPAKTVPAKVVPAIAVAPASRPLAVAQPAEIIHAPALADVAAVATSLVAHLAAATGYPPEVIDLDADLARDLDVQPAETRSLVAEWQQQWPVAAQDMPAPAEFRTLRQVAEFFAGARAIAESNGQAAHAAKPSVARRARLQVVAAPLAADQQARFRPSGASIVLGESPAAEVLGRRLAAEGGTVYRLHPSRGAEQLLAEIEQLPAEPAVRHVFVLTALDEGGADVLNPHVWPRRRAQGLELPSLVLQKWGQRLGRDWTGGPLTIGAATLLGGDFGVEQPVVAPEGGWIAGLLKSLNVELSRHGRATRVKVCDFSPADSAEAIADGLLGELASERTEVEVALAGGQRRLIETVDEPSVRPGAPLKRGETWLLTGGARGITAEVALMLGREYGVNLHLVGRSAAPSEDAPWRNASAEELKKIKQSIVRQAIGQRKSPEKEWDRVKNDIEIHKNLARMRALGLDVHYHSCDVADFAAVEALLGEIRRTAGPLVGIVHGAGYARTSRFETQKREALASTIDAKVAGAIALMRLTRSDPLRYFVGFGSISGRFGGNGLSDYAAANDMLAKLCAWYRVARPECATSCLEWQSWDEVGMAMLPDSTVGTRGVLKMNFLPPAEGVQHLDRELRAGLPASEILLDDGQFERLLWVAPS